MLINKQLKLLDMRYLITSRIHPTFLTEWFDPDNHFNTNPEYVMVVYDLVEKKYTHDGQIWNEIEIDHL